MCKNKTKKKREFFCVNEQSKGLTRAKQNNDSVEQHEKVISSAFFFLLFFGQKCACTAHDVAIFIQLTNGQKKNT